MPKKDSPKGGTYILTGVKWRRPNKDGKGWTIFEQGDEVTLTDDEAARLLSGKHTSFRKKTKEDSQNNDDDTTETDTDSSSRGSTPAFANTTTSK
jgi:hypothetical protein